MYCTRFWKTPPPPSAAETKPSVHPTYCETVSGIREGASCLFCERNGSLPSFGARWGSSCRIPSIKRERETIVEGKYLPHGKQQKKDSEFPILDRFTPDSITVWKSTCRSAWSAYNLTSSICAKEWGFLSVTGSLAFCVCPIVSSFRCKMKACLGLALPIPPLETSSWRRWIGLD